ncbi:FLYWCH zinc finger domain-containing protein [Phthorimaea operculella]|nr:FLYWCH zinc finger domain-containing protein [Phthorimaea operculella]
MSTSGKRQALYQGHCFFLFRTFKATLSWKCTRRSRGCKASLVTTPEAEIIRAMTQHNHHQQQYLVQDGLLQFVQNSIGKQLAIFQSYCYYMSKKSLTTYNWKCTRHSGGCKAALITTTGGEFVRCNTEQLEGRSLFRSRRHEKTAHNHPPQQHVIRNGIYYRI